MSTGSTDFAWLTENSVDVYNKYRGKWIAVRDGQVVGVGDTAVEAAEQARAKFPDQRFILEAVDHDTNTIYAGL